MDAGLPEDIDPEVWFPCTKQPGHRDYLYNARWHTFPGRMAAYCPADQVSFRVSKGGLPDDLPLATRYWVDGFLAGNMPRQPDVDEDDDPEMLRWEQQRDHYFESGTWPRDVRLRCPVCNVIALDVPPYENYTGTVPEGATPPYENALGKPSYEVCPVCDFEFGNDDNPGTAAPQSFDDYRREWEQQNQG